MHSSQQQNITEQKCLVFHHLLCFYHHKQAMLEQWGIENIQLEGPADCNYFAKGRDFSICTENVKMVQDYQDFPSGFKMEVQQVLIARKRNWSTLLFLWKDCVNSGMPLRMHLEIYLVKNSDKVWLDFLNQNHVNCTKQCRERLMLWHVSGQLFLPQNTSINALCTANYPQWMAYEAMS